MWLSWGRAVSVLVFLMLRIAVRFHGCYSEPSRQTLDTGKLRSEVFLQRGCSTQAKQTAVTPGLRWCPASGRAAVCEVKAHQKAPEVLYRRQWAVLCTGEELEEFFLWASPTAASSYVMLLWTPAQVSCVSVAEHGTGCCFNTCKQNLSPCSHRAQIWERLGFSYSWEV